MVTQINYPQSCAFAATEPCYVLHFKRIFIEKLDPAVIIMWKMLRTKGRGTEDSDVNNNRDWWINKRPAPPRTFLIKALCKKGGRLREESTLTRWLDELFFKKIKYTPHSTLVKEQHQLDLQFLEPFNQTDFPLKVNHLSSRGSGAGQATSLFDFFFS